MTLAERIGKVLVYMHIRSDIVFGRGAKLSNKDVRITRFNLRDWRSRI